MSIELLVIYFGGILIILFFAAIIEGTGIWKFIPTGLSDEAKREYIVGYATPLLLWPVIVAIIPIVLIVIGIMLMMAGVLKIGFFLGQCLTKNNTKK